MGTKVTNTGGQRARMWRLNPATKRPEPIDNVTDEYVFPETRDYLLQFTGISDTFPMPKYDNKDETEDFFRLEFTVHRSRKWEGRIVSVLWTPKLGEGSNLGAFLTAIRGTPAGERETVEFADYLGRFFGATIIPNQPNTRPKVTACKPVDATKLGLAVPENLGVPDDDEAWDEADVGGEAEPVGPNDATYEDDDEDPFAEVA